MSKVKPEKLSISFIVVLGLLQTFQAFSQDPYLASGPTIAHDFGVDLSAFQLTISALTIGLGLGQLVAGPLSDSLGRRLPLLVSLGLYVLASAICSISPNLAFFVLARVAQGIAGAALMVVANAVMRDLFEGLKLIHLMGRVLLVQGAAWMIGPFSGSLLLQFTDWRGICLTFGALALVLGVFTFKLLPETLPSEARKKQDLRAMPKRFASLFKDRVYVGLLIVNTFNSIGVYLYILCLPIIYTQGYGVSAADLGIFLALGSFGAYVGVQVGAKLATKVASQWLLLILLAAYIADTCRNLVVYIRRNQHPNWRIVAFAAPRRSRHSLGVDGNSWPFWCSTGRALLHYCFKGQHRGSWLDLSVHVFDFNRRDALDYSALEHEVAQIEKCPLQDLQGTFLMSRNYLLGVESITTLRPFNA
jgi:DHA1 family bicyclomycin/chloramphenicol resistance-like MFS transporter